MKKVLNVLLVIIILAFSFAGCKKANEKPESDKPVENAEVLFDFPFFESELHLISYKTEPASVCMYTTLDCAEYEKIELSLPEDMEFDSAEAIMAYGMKGYIRVVVELTYGDDITYVCYNIYNDGNDVSKIEYDGLAKIEDLSGDARVKYPNATMPNFVDSLDELHLLGLEENDSRLEYIRAFVTGDSAKLEEICSVEKGMYEAYSELVIPRWYAYAETVENGIVNVNFAFAISGESAIESFSPDSLNTGYTVAQSIYGAVLYRSPDFGAPESDAAIALSEFLYRGFTDIPTSNEMSESARWQLTCYLVRKFGSERALTLDEMQKYAKLVLNIDGFMPSQTHLQDGYYTEVGHGGWSQYMRVTNEQKNADDKYEIEVKFYADYSKTIPSCSYKYTVEKVDGEWTFTGCEKITEAEHEPLVSVM